MVLIYVALIFALAMSILLIAFIWFGFVIHGPLGRQQAKDLIESFIEAVRQIFTAHKA